MEIEMEMEMEMEVEMQMEMEIYEQYGREHGFKWGIKSTTTGAIDKWTLVIHFQHRFIPGTTLLTPLDRRRMLANSTAVRAHVNGRDVTNDAHDGKQAQGKEERFRPGAIYQKNNEEEDARTAAMDLHLGPMVSVLTSSSEMTKTVIASPAKGLQKLCLGERQHDCNCGSDPAPDSESEDKYGHDENEIIDRNPVDCQREQHLCFCKMLRDDILSQFARLEKANLIEFKNERHDAKVRLYNALLPLHTLEKIVTALKAKVSSLEQLRGLQTVDRKDLRERVDNLQRKYLKLETTGKTLIVEVQKAKEGRELAAATQAEAPEAPVHFQTLPDTSGAWEAPKISGAPEMLTSPGYLETRVILGAPKRSSCPEALQTYEITGASETPGTPEIPGVPEMLHAPEIPGAPEMLNAPEISGASEMLNASEIPGAPAMLNAPEIPGAPRCSTVVRSQVLLRYSVLLKCSAVGSAPKFTFAQAFDEGQILILLISTIYTVLDENKGDERQL
ncbi:hypothetical protein BDD12DRAFT_877730 [Trichophaea hybrida]|nr:hypothetical protein BDD12DRAFT_877730 [Trichophaea hybrida]